eukprot:CAMPEP_0174310528 /NCGR_PEP_ID=MMETSP0810-20121108/3101_1 /TAXON_ID=73025 ORGANISM="Eutreptiella gymnastica-like, Strain CCMP1594" /NCGR_SAMPLE_ID=MMETSP0810 /ASSEMBLY_ACC=CAM_ASM_000659 /LENGTH=122 /DNA_ID=CAMNT_0015418453 /DNA_START=674 /DNA_END=1042 /DNA_ORIENTATION=+
MALPGVVLSPRPCRGQRTWGSSRASGETEMGQTQGGKGGGASTAGMDWQSVCIQLERQSGASASGGLGGDKAVGHHVVHPEALALRVQEPQHVIGVPEVMLPLLREPFAVGHPGLMTHLKRG